MNNHKKQNKRDLGFEERLERLFKLLTKTERKKSEITSQISSLEKKSKDPSKIEDKKKNLKKIQTKIESIKNEISSIRGEIHKMQDVCLREGHKYALVYKGEEASGIVEIRKCERCGTVESDYTRSAITDSTRLTYKPSYKRQAEQ